MKTLLQAGLSGRVPVLPGKRFPITLAARSVLDKKHIKAAAQSIITRRPQSGYKSDSDFVRQLRGIIPGMKNSDWEKIAQGFRFGMTRERFLKVAVPALGGLILVPAVIGGIWRARKLEAEAPWNQNVQPDMESARAFLRTTIDWLLKQNYPHPEILINYRNALDEVQQAPPTMEAEAVWAGKNFDPQQKKPFILLSGSVLHRYLGLLKEEMSRDLAFETFISPLIREAWGLATFQWNIPEREELMKISSEVFDEEADRQLGEHPGWPDPRTSQFLSQHESQIIRLAAILATGEAFEDKRHFEALSWARSKGLYSPERLSRKLSGMGDRAENVRLLRKRALELSETQGDLLKLIEIVLQHVGPAMFSAFLEGHRNPTLDGYGFYFLLEFERYQASKGREGLSPRFTDIVQGRLQIPPVEMLRSSSQRLLPDVQKIIGDWESRSRSTAKDDSIRRVEVRASGLRRFRAVLATGLVTLAPWIASHAGTNSLDSDKDFIPDVWEQSHGLNANDASDGNQHLNGDKLTNLEKYLLDLDPRIPTGTLANTQLVQLYERKPSLFFWGEAKEANHFLVPDSSPIDGGSAANSSVSIAGVGFQIASYVVADERGWQDHQEVYNRIVTILRYMRDLQAPALDGISHKHGFIFHFLDTNGHGTSEVSSVDHALFLQGALLAAEYYKGTEVERLAHEIYDNTDWTFFADSKGFLYLAWNPGGGPVEGGNWIGGPWDRYSEETAMYILAAGSTTHPIANPRTVWNNIWRPRVQYTSLFTGERFPEFVHVGALFAHQFSHAYVDFRGMRDDAQIDYFTNSVTASLVNRRFAFDLNERDPAKYDTYVHDNVANAGVWGLSSCNRSDGYNVMQPIFSGDQSDIELNNDSGTVVPMAMLGSMPFISGEVERDLRYLFDHRETLFTGEPIDGVYGFVNAYNPGQALSGTRHISRFMIGLDAGTAVGNMENYRSGLLWKFFMRLPEVQNGLRLMGFSDYVSRPNVMNFDNGADPNVFGGYGGAFKTPAATRNYVPIDDPFPDKDYGPQGYVQEIIGPAADDGAWFGLNGHDVSRWDRVSFWIRGDQGGEDIKIGLKDSSWNEFQVLVSDYLAGGITDGWQEVRIPLSVFLDHGVRLISMDNIFFTFADANGGKIFVDDIAFLGDEFRPAPPSQVTASARNSVVTLDWDWNVEPDVVGYRILRKTASDPDFVDITPSGVLWAGNTFTNNVSGIAGDVTYRVIAVDNSTFRNQSDPAPVTINMTPAAPQIASINRIADQGFQVGIAQSTGVYSYRIQYSDDGGQPWKFAQKQVSPGVFEDQIVLANPSGITVWTDDGTATSPAPLGVNKRWYRAMVHDS